MTTALDGDPLRAPTAADPGVLAADPAPVDIERTGPDAAAVDDRRRSTAVRALREPAYVVLFVSGVVANMFSSNARQVGLPISPDRLLFAGAFLLLALDPDAWRTVRLRWRTVHTLFVAMVLLVIWSGIGVATITTTYGLYALLDRLLIPFVAFGLAPVIFATERRRLLLAKTLTVLGVYLGLTAIFEVLGPHALVFPRYIMDPNVGIQFGRARGPFVESEADGLSLIACGFAAGLVAARVAGRWRRVGAASAVVCLLGVFLTETRSCWLGATVGLVAVGLLVPRLRKWVPVAGIATAVAILAALALSPALRATTSSRAGDQRSLYDRQNTNAAAVRVVEAHPLTGLGWVTFESEGSEYVRQNQNYPISTVTIEVHNVFLGRAAELGVPGGALFAACVLAGPGVALRRPRRGLSASLPGEAPDAWAWWLVFLGTGAGWLSAAMSSPLPYPQPNLLFWLIAGIVVIPYLRAPEPAAA